MATDLTTPQGLCNATMGYVNSLFANESDECARFVESHKRYQLALIVFSDAIKGGDIESEIKPAGRSLWGIVAALKEEFHAKESVNG